MAVEEIKQQKEEMGVDFTDIVMVGGEAEAGRGRRAPGGGGRGGGGASKAGTLGRAWGGRGVNFTDTGMVGGEAKPWRGAIH